MPTKNELKYYSSLLTKKFRKSENKFLVEGSKVILEAVDAGFCCDISLGTKSFFDENPDLCKALARKGIKAEVVKSNELKALSDTKNPQGIVAVFKKKLPTKHNETPKLVTALENVSDPGNLGTIIRNCDWFGIESILLSRDCVEVFSPKVIRSSAGSVFHVMINEAEDFYDSLMMMRTIGYKILCADLHGQNIYEYKNPEKTIIVFANEANGPTQKLLSVVDQKITILGKGKAESLNVASASAVILSELTKDANRA